MSTSQTPPEHDTPLNSPLTSDSLGAALRDLRDLPKLQTSPLIQLALVTEQLVREGRSDSVSERARGLRQVLLAAIQELRPGGACSDYGDPQWSDFIILYDQYQRERSPERVRFDINAALVERKGAEHTISPRTYARRNERARRYLLELLQEKESAAQRPVAPTRPLAENTAVVRSDLTWPDLRCAVRQISLDNLTLRVPRNWSAPYVQRQDLLRAFRQFLASDAACFVLTGRSGAGKSSFLRSLLDELEDDRDVGVLAFDAAQFRREVELRECIAGVLRDPPGDPPNAGADFWSAMDRLAGGGQRCIVLVLDEINEFSSPAELLRQVNDLIGSRPWLKIALASRPEAWWSVWRATPLKGRCFFVSEPSVDAEQSERPPLSAWDLQPFSSQEAQEAYVRYQAVYRLETDFEALPRETRELIREPLILWLIAATYGARTVSTALRRDRLVDDYLQALLATRRLHPEDRHLLTQELIPRLELTPGSRARQLGAEHLSDDPDFLRQVFGGRSDGNAVDASLERLVDARILISHRHESPPYIELRHGLIYEHFIGQRLYEERIRAAADVVTACRKLIDSTDSAGEAWGAVKRAVYLAFREKPEQMQALAFTDSAEVASLVKLALLELAVSEPDQARTIVRGIAHRCEGWPRSQPRQRAWLAAEIALAVAAQLDDKDVFLVLLAARDKELGETAVNDVYLWGKQRPDAALDVAQTLGARITRSRWVIDRHALNAAFFLIPLLAIDCWEHDGLHGPRLERLRAICRDIMAGVDRHPLTWAFRGLARMRVAAGAASIGYRLLQEGANIGALDDATSYQRFFQCPAEVRERARSALAWVDRSYGPLADAVDLLAGLYASQDHLSAQIGDAIIMGRGIHRTAEVEPVLRALLERVDDPGHGIEAHACSCWCESAIRQDQIDAHALRVMGELVTRALDACADGYGVVVRAGHVRRYRPLHYYMRLWVRVRPNEPVDLVERYLHAAAEKQNDELLRHVIDSYADVLNLSSHCGAMLRPLAPFVNQSGPVAESLATSLAAIRGFQPALVDRFLLEAEASHALQQEIHRRTRERPRRWHYIGLLGLVQDFIAYAPPTVMQSVLSVWREALGARTWPQGAAQLAAGMLELLRLEIEA